MNDDVAYPIASVLLVLAAVAVFLWPVFDENRLPNRSAQFLGMSVSHSLSKPGIPIKKPQADGLAALQKGTRTSSRNQ